MSAPVAQGDGKTAEAKLRAACELVLLFYQAGHWSEDKRVLWTEKMTFLLGPAISRKENPSDEATTKNLCNAVRAALATHSVSLGTAANKTEATLIRLMREIYDEDLVFSEIVDAAIHEQARRVAPSVGRGNAANSPPGNSNRDWPEDFVHENGKYQCWCCNCEQEFIGHKRRVVCKACAIPSVAAAAEDVVGEEWNLIEGKPAYEWLTYQFPATVGNYDLLDYFRDVEVRVSRLQSRADEAERGFELELAGHLAAVAHVGRLQKQIKTLERQVEESFNRFTVPEPGDIVP